jgi:TnpA family transposase
LPIKGNGFLKEKNNMARRAILTERQRAILFGLPDDEETIIRFYTLSDEDIAIIRKRRGPHNQIGFALQVCAFRFPGRLLQPGELIPARMLAFTAAQLGFPEEDLKGYALRTPTRYEHSSGLQEVYGYQAFSGAARNAMRRWLVTAAEHVKDNFDLARGFLEELRRQRIIVPAASTVERLCADALVEAERRIARVIADRLDQAAKNRLEDLLEEHVDGRISKFVWLRQASSGSSSAAMNKLLDRLEVIKIVNLPSAVINGIPPHRITRLRKEGERLYTGTLRELPVERRLSILAACVVEWRAILTDAAMQTHERITGRLYNQAKRQRDEILRDGDASVARTLHCFADIGSALIRCRESGDDPFAVLDNLIPWPDFKTAVHDARDLTGKVDTSALDFLAAGYGRLRRYAPRFLASFEFQGCSAAGPLLDAIAVLRKMNAATLRTLPVKLPVDFVRDTWRKHVIQNGVIDRQYWEICVLFELRNALRSGDVWINESRRYRSMEQELLPAPAVLACTRIAVPFHADEWLETKREASHNQLIQISKALRSNSLAYARIQDNRLKFSPLKRAAPDEAATLALQLYNMVPRIRITDLLAEVNGWTGFSEAFTHLRTGAPAKDGHALLTVLLADGVNLGLRRMADACTEYSFWELLRVADWHVREETYDSALAQLIDAQHGHPLASVWGDGTTSSSDGQHFSAGGAGEAMNVVNARYGTDPGVSFYTHVSDQFGPYHTKLIPATAHEAPHVLDGLLCHGSGLDIEEHYTDTGGFTDHVFAVSALLGFRFAPRIRDLREKKLYTLNPPASYPVLESLIGGRINQRLIRTHWRDALRLAASMAAGGTKPSHILQKLAAYPRQNGLAQALREIGRVERTLFMLDWMQDSDLRRRVQNGLNKGEARNALARALFFNQLGELRDRTRENQDGRASGLNLLTAAIVLWNTVYLGKAIEQLRAGGIRPADELVAHVSPLAWEHIILTGEYSWNSTVKTSMQALRPLRENVYADAA